jgi:serine O-acetyltransferase
MDRNELNDQLPGVVNRLVTSMMAEPRMQHLTRVYLPSGEVIKQCIEGLRELIYPGYFGKQGLTRANLPFRVGELVMELSDMLYEQVRVCLRYRENIPGQNGDSQDCKACDAEAARIVALFFDRLPGVREMLASDVEAAFESDPAAQSTDETIF